MRKRRIIILAVSFVAVLGGVIWWTVARQPPAAPDPIYAGRPLSSWVAHSSLRIPGLDSNAVPYLVQRLKTREVLRSAYDRVWPHFPAWLKRNVPRPFYESEVKRMCCLYIGDVGPAARPAIPALIHVLREDDDLDMRDAAASALGQIANGKDELAVEALVEAKNGTNASLSFRAGEALTHIAPEAAAKAGITDE